VIDPGSGRVLRSLPAGTPAPDWRSLYRVAAGALQVLDPLTGGLRATHPVPAWATDVHASADGRWLVLSGSGDRFQVQDTAWMSAPLPVALSGRFSFDGISADGRRLYLLERLGGDDYRVRMYDLGARALDPSVIVDKTDLSDHMTGVALNGFTTSDGTMRLTLYEHGESGAFVHALALDPDARFAFCVDLPGPAQGWAFVQAPNGQVFYAVNASAGLVLQLTSQENSPPAVRRGAVQAANGLTTAAMAPDGGTLYVGSGSGVVAVDARTMRTMKTRTHVLTGLAVTGVGVAPDGRAVYAAVDGTRMVRLDPRTLATAGDVQLGAPVGAILHLS
jgi:DNA-binding beta-propeller fold protein YncE